MDEADEERDRELELELEAGGLNSGYKALFSACLQVLPSNREETDRGKRAGEHISLYLFHSFSFSFCSWPYPLPKSQYRHAHTHKQRHSLCVFLPQTPSLTHTHTQIAKALSLISSQDGCCPPVRKKTRKGGRGEAGGER